MNVLHGDVASETFLSEIVGAQPVPGRHMSMESLYEYGSRAGVWRLLRLFRDRGVPLTVFGVAMALARNPAVVDAFLADGHEIASHGLRWISYQQVDEATERAHIAEAIAMIARLIGRPPEGWYTGRDSPRTRAASSSSTAASSTTPTATPTTCRTGPRSTARADRRRTWSCPTRSTPTTCASPRRRASTAATSSSPTSRTRSTGCTPKAIPPASTRRRCCRSGCTAGSSAVPAARAGAGALRRLRPQPSRRLVRAAHRHRAPLAGDPPVPAPRSRRASAARRSGNRRMTLAELNALPAAAFVAALGGVFEHSPWVAERALAARPFASVDALHAAMVAAVAAAGEARAARAAARASGTRRPRDDPQRAHRRLDAGSRRARD